MQNNDIQFPKMLAVLLIFLAILFFIPDLLMYKMIKIGSFEESAAILFFPFIFSIADSITEVYGRNNAFLVLASCYFFSMILSIMVMLAVHLPSPATSTNQQAFDIIFNKGPWIIFVGFLSLTASMYTNIKLMASWKVKLRGKHFIIRSVASSSIGELITTIITYPMIFYHNINDSLLYLMFNAYLFKVAYSIIGAFPARFFVFLLREIDGIKLEKYNETIYNFTKKVTL